MRPPESEQEREAAEAAIADLRAAGYADSEPPPEAAAQVDRERKLNLALVHLTMGRFTEARRVLETLVDADGPRDPRISLWLAHCCLMSGDPAACREAIASVPSESPATIAVNLIESHLDLAEGNRAAALAAIQRAESQGRDLPLVNFAAGMMYMRMECWEEAEDRFRRSVELDPAFLGSHEILSWVLSERGKSAEAAEAALKSLEIDYSSAFSHFALGLARVGTGDGEQALRAFEKSIALNPGAAEARAWAQAIRSQREREASLPARSQL